MKFCVFVTLCAVLIFYSSASVANPNLEILGEGEVRIFSTEVVESPLVDRVTNVGFAFIYHTTSANAPYLRAKFTRIDGESITLRGTDLTARQVLRTLNYRKISSNAVGALEYYYAFSMRGSDFIISGDTRINLQVAQRGDVLTVGWPVILGSF